MPHRRNSALFTELPLSHKQSSAHWQLSAQRSSIFTQLCQSFRTISLHTSGVNRSNKRGTVPYFQPTKWHQHRIPFCPHHVFRTRFSRLVLTMHVRKGVRRKISVSHLDICNFGSCFGFSGTINRIPSFELRLQAVAFYHLSMRSDGREGWCKEAGGYAGMGNHDIVFCLRDADKTAHVTPGSG
jgi:hypothetical protein